ncbi:MAG TPA: Ig-like domain-containing protein [Gemmatimonadales bacterium]|nr:Ig-like domain-containing protein [Gemmatimonadales bacterium]
MTLQLLRRACGAAALMAAAVLGCSPGGGDNTGVGGVLVVSRVDVEGGNRIVLIGGSRQLQAIPRTSTGIAVPGKAVVWSSANNGQAQVSTTGVVTGISAGMVSISAIVDGITGRIDIDVRPVPVAAVEVTAGVATLEAGESTQLQAVTRDSIGGVLAGRQVAWSSSNNAAAIVSPTGLVTAMGAGSATISATSEGRSGSAILLVTARSASRLGFVVQPSNGTAGLALSPPIQVAFQDDGGATATTATGTVTLSFSANPTGATLGGTLTAQAVGGIATFADVRVNRSGQPYSLQAIAQGFAPATSTTFSVAAGAPAALAIMTAPAGSGASGDPLGQQPVIQLHDAQGNEARQAGVTVTAVIASGSGTLGGTSAIVTNAEGRAVFTDLAIIGPVGTYTLRFEAAGLTPVTSGPIGLGAGNATQITFSAAPPATTINGQPLGTTVRVQLRDGVGNPVAQSGTSVTAGLQSGTGALGGTLVVVTGADGSAAFTNLTITGIVGEFVLRFSAPGLTPAVSNPILLNAGPETAIGFVTAPGATAVNGVVLPTAPVLQLRDISGNAVAKAGVTVQAFSQSAVLGSLQGTTTLATNADGRVTFGDLVILGRVGQYTLAFRSGILSEALSNLIMLTAGPAAGIGFTTFPPLGTASGETLSPQPVIQIVDQSSNPVALGGVTITASLASGSGVLGGTLSVTTDAGGAAAFTDLAITGPSGPHTIRFRTGGYPDLISPTITVGSGSPTQVTFTVAPPATAANGTMIAPAVVVQLRDGVGNPTLLSGVAVTASRSAGSATLSGTISVATDANGSAIFDDLVLTGIAGDHQLTFSAAGLTPAVSNTIVLEPGAGTQLTFTTPPPASATNGVDLSPAVVVQLRDLSGNAVSSGGVNVTASIVTGAGGTLGGTTTVATGSNGSATFGTLRITGTVGAYTLRFSATGVTAATSNPLTLEPGLATALAIQTQPPPSTSSGAVLSPQPVVRVVDESGNTVTSSSLAVTASLASGPGTLDGPKTLAAVNGVVSYADLVITGPTGTYQIGFGATGVSGATSGTISVGAGAAAGLELVGTPPTSGTNDEALTPAVSVRLVDGAANPVAQSGVSVSAVLASGPGSLGGTVTVNTDGNGIATFDNLIITGTVGSYTIRFEVSGITPVTTGPIALSAGAATQLGFSTTPAASSTNGAPLVTQPVVQLQDASGNPVSQSGVTITAAITVNPGGSLSNASAVTAGNGQATFSGLTITGLVGLYTLTYGSGALTPVSATVSLSAGPAVAVKIVTQPSASPTNTVAFAQQPVIRLVDQSGNFTGSNGTAVTAVLGQTPGPAALGGTTTVLTGPPGVRATFTDLAISGTTGTYTLVFSSPGLASEESIAITLNPGSATQLLFTTTPPSSAVNGTVLAPAIGVRLGDATGNAVPTAGISIAAAIASGSGAVLGGTTPRLTDGTGGVSFNDLTLTGTVGDFTLTFTSSGLTPATTGIITLTSGPASKLAFTTAPPPAGVNGELLSPATVVQLRDQSDNVVNTTGTPITAAISAGAGGTLSGTLVVNTTSGSSSFGDLVITGPVGNYTLRFTSPGLTSVSAPAPLALSAGPATQLGLVVAPATSATSGAALSPQPQVQVQDQSGNPVGTGGLTVTAAVNAGASLSNATATTDAGGLAVFSGLTITGPTGNYTLSFSATSLTSVASDPITLTAGAASQLAFITAPPVSAINGAILNPQPVIELRDASNNPVLTAGVDVTASLISGPGSLLGTLTVQTTADGRATFSNLELRGLTGNYVIRFTAGGLTLDSDPITLAVGAASQLLFDQAPPPTATNGTTFSTSTIVRLADAGGNLVATDGVSVLAAVASGPGATLGGTTTRQTVSGQAIFNDLSLTGTAGIYTLDFTSGSLTKATSNSITLEPGPATKLVFITTTPATAQSGVVFDPSPVVQLQDASSNNVPQAGVSVTVARFSGDSTAIVSGGSAVTDAMGRASFSSLAITGPADDYVLAFASSPLAGLLSPTITLTAGGAVKLGFVTTPSVTATNGQPLAQQPVVQLLDAANNPVAEAGRSITISMPEAGSLTADALTALTDGSGRATFSGVTITGLVGDRTLAFSGSGLTTLTSGAIALVAGPAAALAMVTQPPGSAVEDEPLSTDPVVRLVDVSGNNVDSTGVDITATVNPLSATITGTVTVSTGAGGAATFPGLSLGGAEGTYRLAFSGPSLTGVESGDVTLLVPATVEITVAPAENAASGVPLSPQPSVVVRDGAAAPLVGVSVTATLLFESGAPATLGGSVTLVTGAGGAATWTDLTITGGPGTYRLQFTTANGTLVTAAASTVIP